MGRPQPEEIVPLKGLASASPSVSTTTKRCPSGVTSYCWPRPSNPGLSSNSGRAAPGENAGLVVTETAMRVSPSTYEDLLDVAAPAQ